MKTGPLTSARSISGCPRSASVVLRVILIGALLAAPEAAPAQQESEEEPKQEPSLNNLVHGEGYETAPLGELGRIERRGSGPVDLILVAGAGFGASAYGDFMEAYGDKFTMYAVTLPGFDGTLAPAMPNGESSYADATWTRTAGRGIVDLIESRGLENPIGLGHMYPGGQIAVRMAASHSDLIGGAAVVGAEAARIFRPEDPMSPEERATYVDRGLAPKWFKTVTRDTWENGTLPPETLTRDGDAAERLWKNSIDDPLPVQIRYLCEFLASDVRRLFPKVRAPMLVVRPGFSKGFRQRHQDLSLETWYVDSWTGAERKNERINVRTVKDARIFIWKDRPERFARLLNGLLERAGLR